MFFSLFAGSLIIEGFVSWDGLKKILKERQHHVAVDAAMEVGRLAAAFSTSVKLDDSPSRRLGGDLQASERDAAAAEEDPIARIEDVEEVQVQQEVEQSPWKIGKVKYEDYGSDSEDLMDSGLQSSQGTAAAAAEAAEAREARQVTMAEAQRAKRVAVEAGRKRREAAEEGEEAERKKSEPEEVEEAYVQKLKAKEARREKSEAEEADRKRRVAEKAEEKRPEVEEAERKRRRSAESDADALRAWRAECPELAGWGVSWRAMWDESKPVTAWAGVTFGEAGGADAGRVVQIKLEEKGLTGEVPAALGGLTALTLLSLDQNRLTSVPAELGALTALTTLTLYGNLLTSVPAELGRLTALTLLFLSGNLLTSVPAALGALTALTALHLDGNQLTSVPDELGGLTTLTMLDLSWNQLTSVPAEWEVGGALQKSGCMICSTSYKMVEEKETAAMEKGKEMERELLPLPPPVKKGRPAPGPVGLDNNDRHVIHQILNPPSLSSMSSYDVARIYWSLSEG